MPSIREGGSRTMPRRRSTHCHQICVRRCRTWKSWSKTNRRRASGSSASIRVCRSLGRGSYYGGVLPDKITIYRGPLVRLYGHDAETLRREVRRVVLHEVAHHFGISDERLIEIDRY